MFRKQQNILRVEYADAVDRYERLFELKAENQERQYKAKVFLLIRLSRKNSGVKMNSEDLRLSETRRRRTPKRAMTRTDTSRTNLKRVAMNRLWEDRLNFLETQTLMFAT
jgi:hypothetical protein